MNDIEKIKKTIFWKSFLVQILKLLQIKMNTGLNMILIYKIFC